MRRKLSKFGAVSIIIMALAVLSAIIAGRVRPQILVQPSTSKIIVNKKLQDSKVDLNKPVIDLSGWQRPTDIDYNVLSQQVIGAIIRVQTGRQNKQDAAATKSGADTQYQTHIKALQARGVPVAVYAFVTGKTNAQMVQQAKDFYNRSKDYKPTYYWLDVEVTNMKNMNSGIEAFRAELAKLGVKNIGIYTQPWFIDQNHIDVKKFSSIWIADYGRDTGMWDSSPSTDLNYDMQQFTDRGQVPGYSEYCDLSMIRSDQQYDKLFKHKA